MLWRRIVRVAGYVLAALALAALGGDILGWVRGDGFEFTIIGRHWYALDASSLNLSQAVVQRYVHPWLWDPAIVAVLLYAALLRFAKRPERTFSVMAAIVLLISVIPDFTYIPSVPGATNSQIAILVLMHIVAATVIVGLLTTRSRPQEG